MKRYILLLIILNICISSAYAQRNDIRFKHLTKEAGLSQSTVYAIAEDKYGFIWIGTVDGLNRYDGYNLKIYSNSQEDTNSLANNRIYCLLLDNEGILWVATMGGGLCRYNYATDNFTTYRRKNNTFKSLGSDVIMALHQDKEGLIWIGTAEGGLSCFNKKTSTFKTYKSNADKSNSLANHTIFAIAEDNEGILWLGTGTGGVFRFDKRSKIFTSYCNDSKNLNSLNSNVIKHIFVDKQNTLWVATDKGADRYDRDSDSFKHFVNEPNNPYSLPSNEIYYIYQDRSENLWFGTYAGLSRLGKENRERVVFQNFQNDLYDSESLNNNLIRCIFQDRSGIIWVGTYTGGVNSFLPEGEKFIHYYIHPNVANSLSNNAVRSFSQDIDGNIWLGTLGGGISKFEPNSESFTHFKNSPNVNSLTSNIVTSVVCDSKNNIWIGTGHGLDKLNTKTNKFTHFEREENNSNSLSSNNIRTLMIDREGLIWIATSGGGVNCYNETTKQFTRYQNKKGDSTSFSDTRAMGLFQDSEGYIWIGSSNNGLNKLNKQTGKFEHFRYNQDNQNSLSSDRVFCIYESNFQNEQVFWIGTGGGLSKLNPKTKKFDRYTKANGLASNVILGIVEDSKGFLWLTTSNGLHKMNTTGDSLNMFNIYDEKEGLLSNECNENAYFKDKDGNIYVGSNNGFNVFHPNKVKNNPNVPPIYLIDFAIFNSSVEIGGNSLLTKNIIETDSILLSYLDYVFSFEITALNYCNPEKNSFMYLMDGFNKDWTLINSKRRNITYTNLEPRTYTFMVKASNNDGVWNEKPREVKIIIAPPIWKTIWFRTLSIILIISLLYFFYALRLRALKRSKILLEETVKIRTEEIFQQKEEIQAQVEQLEQANSELEKLSIVASETDNAVLIASPKGEIEWVNAGFERLYGVSIEEFKSQKGDFFLTSQNIGSVRELLSSSIKENRSVAYTSKVINPKNEEIWVQTTLTPLFDKEGTLYRIIAIESDITQIKIAEEEIIKQSEEIKQKSEELRVQSDNLKEINDALEIEKDNTDKTLEYLKRTQSMLVQSEKMASLGQLTAGIAHEINNPVNFISSGIDSLHLIIKDLLVIIKEYDALTVENVVNQLNTISELKKELDYELLLNGMSELSSSIKTGADRTAEIVRGLRKFSRLDEDDLKMINLHENIDATLIILHNQYKERIEIIRDYGVLPQIECYPGKLNQVFLNILVNAIEAIPKKGFIKIVTHLINRDSKKNVEIHIIDNGIGMTNDVKSRIFEPFFTMKEVGKGTGLGLSISYGIIEQHKGQIEVQSEKGKGTEFIIYLPIRSSLRD